MRTIAPRKQRAGPRGQGSAPHPSGRRTESRTRLTRLSTTEEPRGCRGHRHARLPSMGWPELYERGAAHRGAVGPRCAAAAGIPPTTFTRTCRRQGFEELRPRVFLLPGWRSDAASRAFAAALSAGRDAALTGWAALAHQQLARWPSRPELLLPAGAYPRPLENVRTRWSASLHEDAIVDVSGVRFTDTARSLCHLAERLPLPKLRAIGLDAIGKDLLRPEHLERELRSRGRFPGRGTVRQLLTDLQGDGSESGFEFDTRDRLADAGLQPDDEQPHVRTRAGGTRRIDIAFSDELVGIECLGFAYHSSVEHLEADVVRTNELAELDAWLILRLTFRMFHQDWSSFLHQVRRCLEQRRAR